MQVGVTPCGCGIPDIAYPTGLSRYSHKRAQRDTGEPDAMPAVRHKAADSLATKRMTERQVNARPAAWLALLLTLPLRLALGTDFTPGADAAGAIARGKEIAFDPARGNCLACHQIQDGESAGDLGPPLVAIRARFPDKRLLREQLWDPMANNPRSRMPPFGRHRILTEGEIDRVVEYLYSL